MRPEYAPTPDSLTRLPALLDPHTAADLATPHASVPPRTVAYRLRELRSTPGWTVGDRPTAHATARRAITRARARRAGRATTPTDRVLAAHVDAHRTATDVPDVPAGPRPMWLRDAHRLDALAGRMRAVAAALPPGTGAEAIGTALVECAGACRLGGNADALTDVETAWAAEPAPPEDPPYWELTRVPLPLYEQTRDAGDVAHTLALWLDSLTH
ncbi:hypothetical protein [Embleya sp. NPDC005971]|uniref:hypothetical protein n=1 Tax=Embleya sp. NPDC005971 TaxID=3156724 RepID=UPI00340C6BC1